MLKTNTYEGDYSSFDKPVIVVDSLFRTGVPVLDQLKEHIENSMGFDGAKFDDSIAPDDEYMTAQIQKKNIFGKHCGRYYFSKMDNAWHFSHRNWTDYNSWDTAVAPVKQIMQFALTALGYRAEQRERDKRLVQKMKVDSLYGSE